MNAKRRRTISGLDIQALRRAEMDALPKNAEIGVGEARSAVAKLGKQAA